MPKTTAWQWGGARQGLGSAQALYFNKLLEVWGLVCLLLDQGSPVELAAAEADVGLHVRQLGRQDVADHLHRHLLPRHLLANPQRSAGKHENEPPRLRTRSDGDTAHFRVGQVQNGREGHEPPGPLKGLSMWQKRNRKRNESSATERCDRSVFLWHDDCLLVLGNKNFKKGFAKHVGMKNNLLS